MATFNDSHHVERQFSNLLGPFVRVIFYFLLEALTNKYPQHHRVQSSVALVAAAGVFVFNT